MDLRQYSRHIESELRKVELRSIEDCILFLEHRVFVLFLEHRVFVLFLEHRVFVLFLEHRVFVLFLEHRVFVLKYVSKICLEYIFERCLFVRPNGHQRWLISLRGGYCPPPTSVARYVCVEP